MNCGITARISFFVCVLSLISSTVAPEARAANDTWLGGGADGKWTTPGNWNSGTGNAPPVNGDTLVFDGSTNLTTTNDFTFTAGVAANRVFNGITFAPTAGSFSLSGNSFVLSGDINDNSANAQTITLTQGGPTGPNYGLILDGGTRNFNVVSGGALNIGQLTFGNNPVYVNNTTASAAQSANVSTLNINSNGVTIGNLVVQTNASASNVINIPTGVTLNSSGAGNNNSVVVIGTPPILTTNTADTSNLVVQGAGSWVVSNTTANFTVGVGSGNNNTSGFNPTLDMSGLANFTYNSGAAALARST